MTIPQEKKLNIEGLNIGGSWLTVNRACQFRCKWCYAEDTNYSKEDDMSLELARNLIDFQASIGVSNVLLIGGEPTLWEHLFTVIELIAEKGMKSTIVTNGMLLADAEFLERLKASPVNNISISLKSGNKKQHKELTGSARFDDLMKGISSAANAGLPLSFSVTINSLVLDNIVEIVKIAADNGARGIGLSLCTTTFQDDIPQRGYMPEPQQIIARITEAYDEMASILNVTLQQSLPSCLWPNGFIEDLEKKKGIAHGCHVRANNGLIFDQKGNILVCHALFNFPIGTFGKDFDEVESFKRFWFKEEVRKLYDEIISYPSKSCTECSEYIKCGGGCPLFWFVYKPECLIPV